MPLNQSQYTHAMELDTVTDKPMPKVAAQLMGSNVAQPTDIQSRYAQTIQTHNAVSVGASGTSDSSWIDADGFSEIGITLLNSGATSSKVHVLWSSDGVTWQGADYDVIATGTPQQRAGNIVVKARYFKIQLFNGHTASVTMSAWAYLKA
ncbi:hypothetical protein [Bacillus sp. FJAT-29814]|uniref:hypothetical protein n=1 Tax=Bacillus sp. FJAT-29814 TaxID=1729688 RepID=UPI00082D7671|nr:hypothetical protein [Bacillus sp. FJAT-29814]